jgi:hypothetical protein
MFFAYSSYIFYPVFVWLVFVNMRFIPPPGNLLPTLFNRIRWIITGIVMATSYVAGGILLTIGAPLTNIYDPYLQPYVYYMLLPFASFLFLGHCRLTYQRWNGKIFAQLPTLGICTLGQISWLIIHCWWLFSVYNSMAAFASDRVVQVKGGWLLCVLGSTLVVCTFILRVWFYVRYGRHEFEVKYFGTSTD